MYSKQGYKNKLYYPYTLECDATSGYWLASPSVGYNENELIRVENNGFVSKYKHNSYGNYRNVYSGIRPVVSLNSGIKVNATDEE